MKIDDAIEQLQKIRNSHGNIDVLITRTICDSEERGVYFKVCPRQHSFYQGYWETDGQEAVEMEWH